MRDEEATEDQEIKDLNMDDEKQTDFNRKWERSRSPLKRNLQRSQEREDDKEFKGTQKMKLKIREDLDPRRV